MKIMETIITMKLPLKRVKRVVPLSYLPFRDRWFGWLFTWGGGSISEFGGHRTNKIRHLGIFRWHILTVNRNEYHNQSDAKRADEYLAKWSECEKELQGLRLIVMGDRTNAEVKKVIKEALGVDLDEGRIL